MPLAAEPREMTHREVVKVLVGLMTAMLLAALDQTIVATALPTIVGELGGLSQLSWVVTAYLLTLTVAMPLYGKVSDLYGRKRLFQIAITVFVVGSAACALATSMGQLIAFRAIQGLGAGGIGALSHTIIGGIVPPRQRGRYQGYIGAVYALASVAGPLLGGYFVDQFDWRWVFWINLPLGAVAIAVTQANLRLDTRGGHPRIDWLGAALLTVGISGLLLATVWGGQVYPWASPVILSLAGGVAAALIMFVIVERRASEPILPPELFRDRGFTVSIGIAAIIGAALFGAVTFLPLFLQTVVGLSATSAGLLLIPLVAGLLIGVLSSTRMVTRWGRYKVFPIIGTAALAVGMGLLASMDTTTTQLQASAYMVLVGLGVGLNLQVLVIAVQNAAPPRHLGAATAAVQFFRSIGATVGVGVCGALFTTRLAATLAAGGLSTSAGIDPQSLSTPETLATLPLAIQTALRGTLADAITWVFLWTVPIALIGFALAWRLRELPLRATHAVARVDT
ncbi:MAG: MDR family MFS transporter [Egibacteraceae bacterium]